MSRAVRHPTARYGAIGLLALVYVITAKLGLMMDAVSGFATLVWPPTGIALAALLLFGREIWPGIMIGAFAVNWWTGAPPLVAAGIGAGNTLEALTGVLLLRRARFDNRLERIRDAAAFAILAAVLSTTLSASIGVWSLLAGGIVTAARFGETWRAWWLGDLTGALLVTPLLLGWIGWGTHPRGSAPPLRIARIAEGLALAALVVGTCLFIFGRPTGTTAAEFQKTYLLLPVILWASIRFGVRGAAATAFFVSAIAIWSSAQGHGPFARAALHESLFHLQTFMAIVSLTGLMLAAVIAERNEAEIGLRAHKDALDESAIVAITDPRGIITHVNDMFCRISKYSRDELLGRDHRIINSGYHPKEFFRDFWRTIQAGRVWHGEIRNRAKDGSIYWVDTSIVPFLDAGGKPYQYVAIRSDITARKKAEEESRRLAALVQDSGEAIIGKDLDGRITSWNRAAEKLYGYSRAEVLGKPIDLIVPEDCREELRQATKAVVRGKPVGDLETVRVSKDGRYRDVMIGLSPVHDEAGRIVGLSAIARDISERKNTEKMLRHQKEELEQFAYVTSHDLREPLRTMAGYSYLLLERASQRLEPEEAGFLQYIVDGAKRMDGLIADLLAYARAGRVEQPPESVDLEALVRQIVQDLSPLIEKTGAQVRYDPLPSVQGHLSLLRQVFQNLIANALKHGAQDRTPEVHVRSRNEGPRWKFEVEDNGKGIPPEHHERVFRLFQRLEGRGAGEGTGLGLAITHKIVEQYGGKIWIESDGEHGARFCFVIPRNPLRLEA